MREAQRIAPPPGGELGLWALGWCVPVIVAGAAEIALRIWPLKSDALALPSQVVVSLGRLLADGSILTATQHTLASVFYGLAWGGLPGVALGFLLALLPRVERLLAPSIEVFRPIPPVALIPLALLTFGFGPAMEASIVAFTCFWPMLLLTLAAVRGVEPRLSEVARLLQMSFAVKVVCILWPATLPRLAVALRLAIGISLVVAVSTEIAANPNGIGYAILTAQQELRPADMYAFVLWLAFVGWGLNALMLRLQTRLATARGLAWVAS